MSDSLQIREHGGSKQLSRPGYKKHWGFWPCHKDTQAALWRVLYSKELRTPANGHVSEPRWKGISLLKSIKSSDDSKFSYFFIATS